MSLKTNITEYLKQNGRITLDQLYLFCGKEHKKTSNAERRLRELMSPQHKDYNPNVKAERNAKGAIVAYVWGKTEYFPKNVPLSEVEYIQRTTYGTYDCCYSLAKFGTHDPNCQTLKVKETNKLF